MYKLKNETPYDIRYITLENVIREIAVISFLLELDFNPLTAWWAIPKTIQSFSAVVKAVTYLFRVLVDRRFGHDEEDFMLIRTGSIAPGETKTWFEGGLQTVEALLQVATFTDQEKQTSFLGLDGMSLIVLPSLENYCSKMDAVHFSSGASAVDWGSVEIGWITKIIEVLDKIKEIIKKIHEIEEDDASSENDHQHGIIDNVCRISYQSDESERMILDFRTWCHKEGILKESDDNTAKYIENLKKEWLIAAQVNSSSDFSYFPLDIIKMPNEVKMLQQRFEQIYSPRPVSNTRELLQHSKWRGLPFYIKVPPLRYVPIVRRWQNNPPCPFMKAVGKEIDPSAPSNQHSLWGRGATLFLEMAVTNGPPLNSNTFFKAEAIHVHLPSLKDPSGNPCPRDKGFSYWIMNMQWNDLSNAGWCVNVEYGGLKYQLVNDKHIICVNISNKPYTDRRTPLLVFGQHNQRFVSSLCSEPVSEHQARLKQFFYNIDAALFRESMLEVQSDSDEESSPGNAVRR